MDKNTTFKILAVDDVEIIRSCIHDFFKRRGYSVLTADSAESALPIIKDNRPDVVLLDMNMPNMNGLDLLRILRTFDKETKVIMISGYDFEPDQITEMRGLKVSAVLRKPVGIEDLEEMVKTTLFPA